MADAREDLAAGLTGGAPAVPQRLRDWLAAHERIAAGALATLVLLALHATRGGGGFPFDAGEYWRLADPRQLLASPAFRGYLFPMLLLPARALGHLLGSDAWGFAIASSLANGCLLTTLLPAAWPGLLPARIGIMRRLVPVVLLAGLFPGLLVHPLSDLPALLMALGVIACVKRAWATTGRWSLASWFASGCAAAAAYNTRPIYLFAALVLVMVPFVGPGRVAVARGRAMALLALVAGGVVVSLPQAGLNAHAGAPPSLLVRAQMEGRSLFAMQLVWGLSLQRYETSIGGPELPAGGVHYLDPAGVRLLRAFQQSGAPVSVAAYVRLALAHPLDAFALYVRHAVNGLDLRDGEVYLQVPSSDRSGRALINLAILVLAVACALSPGAAMKPGPARAPAPRAASWWLLAMVLLPVAAIVPGAIETRFFLPLHLLAYATIAYRFDAAAVRAGMNRYGLRGAGLLAVLVALFLAISSATMGQVSMEWPESYRAMPAH